MLQIKCILIIISVYTRQRRYYRLKRNPANYVIFSLQVHLRKSVYDYFFLRIKFYLHSHAKISIQIFFKQSQDQILDRTSERQKVNSATCKCNY